MKIKSYLYIALFGLISLACARFEEEAIQESAPLVEMRLTACMDSEEAITKTYLDGQPVASVRNTYWMPEDAIGVTGSKNVAKFENICEDTTSVAFFEGQYESLNTYYAFYPYSADASFSSSDASLTLNIPQVQKYQENTFATDVVPMVAKFNIGDSLYFKNICGGFVVKMTGTEKVQSLRLTAYTSNGSDAKISGPFKVNMKSETFEMEPTESSMTSILVDCADGVQLNEVEPTAFHFILPPAVYNGIKLLVTTTDGARMIKSTDKAVNIRRSNISYISAFKFEDNVVPVDLSQQGHSNCYIVPEVGIYSFDATVIGNGTFGMIDNAGFHTEDYHITPESVEVLWQDRENVIYDVTLREGRVHFLSDGVEGNALVAVIDASGNILWSWHIWSTDQPKEQKYVNGTGTYMVLDRNLGATRASRGEGNDWQDGIGTVYFWGRKDPFYAETFIRGKESLSMEESILNPTTSHSTGSWTNYKAWMDPYISNAWSIEQKTIYDPCPAGYRVPIENIWNGFTLTNSTSTNIDEFNIEGTYDCGFEFYINDAKTETAWYPPTHSITWSSDYWEVGAEGRYWSVNPVEGNKKKRYFHFMHNSPTDTNVEIGVDIDNGWALSVRCMKDQMAHNISVELSGVHNVTQTSAYVTGEVAVQGNFEVEKSGYVIGTDSSVSVDNGRVVYSDAKTGDISKTIDDLSPMTQYYIKAFAVTADGRVYYSYVKHFITPNESGIIDLNLNESANCYIVDSKSATYCFDLVKGNSSESVGAAVSAEILWETYNSLEEVLQGTVVSSVSIEGNHVIMKIQDDARHGNALVVARDASGVILWSWHIWVTDFDPEVTAQTYISGAVMMDRNLGALRAIPGDPSVNGLFYQWGRKDPQLSAYNGDTFITAYPSDVKQYTDSENAQNLDFAIQNPSTVLAAGYNKIGSWNYDKTIYDPCPAGWRVPDAGPGVWEGIDTHVMRDGGYYFETPYSTPTAFYPATGYTHGDNNSIMYYGGAIYSWSCTNVNDKNDKSAYTMCMYYETHDPQRSTGKNNEHPVRCMKIDNTGETGRGDDYIVDDEYEW